MGAVSMDKVRFIHWGAPEAGTDQLGEFVRFSIEEPCEGECEYHDLRRWDRA